MRIFTFIWQNFFKFLQPIYLSYKTLLIVGFVLVVVVGLSALIVFQTQDEPTKSEISLKLAN